MPKKITNDKSFLKFAQKKYNISDKEMAKSEIWIDGFKNALAARDRVGAFANWKPIPTIDKIKEHRLAHGWPVWVICNNDGCSICDIAWWNNNTNDWDYLPTNSGMYKTPTHYAEIEFPKNNPVAKQYKDLT